MEVSRRGGGWAAALLALTGEARLVPPSTRKRTARAWTRRTHHPNSQEGNGRSGGIRTHDP